VRTSIKKLRALLHLARPALPGTPYRRALKALHAAAQCLAPPRDASVKLKALDEVLKHFRQKPSSPAVRRFRSGLQRRSEQEAAKFIEERRHETVRAMFQRLSEQLADLSFKCKGWSAIGPGLESAYRAGRRDFHAAVKTSSAEQFHRWRKHAKILWYQVQTLRPVWPEQVCALADELKSLGEYLGDDHDLVLLRNAAAAMTQSKSPPRALEALIGMIDRRESQFRSAALQLGARLYAEKPGAFCERFCRYWRLWRSGKRRKALTTRA